MTQYYETEEGFYYSLSDLVNNEIATVASREYLDRNLEYRFTFGYDCPVYKDREGNLHGYEPTNDDQYRAFIKVYNRNG